MNELLKKLVESKLLSEETQVELMEAFSKQLTESIDAAKEEAAQNTKVELTEKWIAERDQLIEALDKKVEDQLKVELVELKESIENFRNLEVEYAEKLIEHKAAMAEEVKADMEELLESLDAFLETRITVEMEELKEHMEEVRKLDFGRRVFEAFAKEFDETFTDEEGVKAELEETKDRLSEVEKALVEAVEELETLERKEKMEEILSNLDSHQHEVMETLLDKVPTEKLEEAYKKFLPKLIKESVNTSGKEDKVLAEDVKDEKTAVVETVVVSGDVTLNENVETTKPKLSSDAYNMLRKLGGIN